MKNTMPIIKPMGPRPPPPPPSPPLPGGPGGGVGGGGDGAGPQLFEGRSLLEHLVHTPSKQLEHGLSFAATLQALQSSASSAVHVRPSLARHSALGSHVSHLDGSAQVWQFAIVVVTHVPPLMHIG